MKIKLFLVSLILLSNASFAYSLPSELGNETLLYSKRASIYLWLVSVAVKASPTSTADSLRQNLEKYGLKYVFTQPISIFAEEDSNGTMSIVQQFNVSEEPARFNILIKNKRNGKFPCLIKDRYVPGKKVICDNPELAAKLGRVPLKNRSLIGNIVAKYGYIATIDSIGVIATPKFFRAGMTEIAFQQALSEASEYYLGKEDCYNLYLQSNRDMIAAAEDFQAKLHAVKEFNGLTFPFYKLPIQAKKSVLNLLALNQWSQFWNMMVCTSTASSQ